MPTPTNSARLLSILIGRHRKLSNLMYKKILNDLSNGSSKQEDRVFYRGLVNDLTSMLKEMREQEAHSKSFEYYSILDEINSENGKDFNDKLNRWISNAKKTAN